MLGDSFIRLVFDLIGVFIHAEQSLYQWITPDFGVNHGWSVVTSDVCCSDWLLFLLITWCGARVSPDFSFVSGHHGLHDQGE